MTGDDVMIRMIFLLFLHDNKALDSSSSVCITNYPLQLFIILLLSSNDTRYPANQIIIIICASAGRDSASADAPVVRVLGILSMIRLSLLAAENNRFEVGFLYLHVLALLVLTTSRLFVPVLFVLIDVTFVA